MLYLVVLQLFIYNIQYYVLVIVYSSRDPGSVSPGTGVRGRVSVSTGGSRQLHEVGERRSAHDGGGDVRYQVGVAGRG